MENQTRYCNHECEYFERGRESFYCSKAENEEIISKGDACHYNLKKPLQSPKRLDSLLSL